MTKKEEMDRQIIDKMILFHNRVQETGTRFSTENFIVSRQEKAANPIEDWEKAVEHGAKLSWLKDIKTGEMNFVLEDPISHTYKVMLEGEMITIQLPEIKGVDG